MSVESRYERQRRQFGIFGGRYLPEVLWAPLEEVARAYELAVADEDHRILERRWFASRVGRPTPLTHLPSLSDSCGGAQVWIKREDLCFGGSFCVTSAVSQALVARRMNKRQLLGETATGDFGVALASVGRALGLDVTIYMARGASEQEPRDVTRMKGLGAQLAFVDGASRGRMRSMAEALRVLSVTSEKSFYATSSLASPQPYPKMVGDSLSVIGRECLAQLAERDVEAEYVIAPVGSGSFAAGLFGPFVEGGGPQIVGVQSGGEEESSRDAASLVRGRPGVCLGTRSLVLQDEEGQIEAAHSAASGLAMPVAGPQHARWLQEGKVHYVTVDDEEAAQARLELIDQEGIFVCRESGYGLAYAMKLAPTLRADQHLVVGITGSGAPEADDLNGTRQEGSS